MSIEPIVACARKSELQLRPVPGCPGYLINQIGEVFSTVYGRCNGRADKTSPPRKKKLHLATTGYFDVAVCIRGVERRDAVHRMVARAFLGPRPFPDAQARHLNGVKTDNRPDNLAWGSAKDDADDRRRHGTIQIGVRSPRAAFDAKQVADIRAAALSGIDCGFLARRFGVTPSCIEGIRKGRSYPAVQASPNVPPSIVDDYAIYPKRNSGTKNRSAKLSEEAVREIRIRRSAGESLSSLSGRFGVAPATIIALVRRRTWTHVL